MRLETSQEKHLNWVGFVPPGALGAGRSKIPTKVEFVRKLFAVVLALALLALAGCGAGSPKTVGDAEPLSSIEITPGADDNTAPSVEFDTPLDATAAGARVVEEGDGPEIKENQDVSYKLAGYSTEDGSELGNLFGQDAQILSLTEEMKAADAEIYEILLGSRVGSWVAYVRPSEPAAAPEGESTAPDEPASASEVLILKIVGAEDRPEPPRTLEQSEVKELVDSKSFPTVEFDADGKPTISLPEGKEAPDGLAVHVLEEGDGETLTAESTITADYAGVRWEDGKVFDSSYERGEPAEFGLTQVIQGWTEGLTGQKVGSKVLLSIPAEMAYGKEAPEGTPAGPLVFVVDIKSAK